MFIVYDKDMNKKEFPKGVRPLDIFIHSIPKNRVTNTIEGRNGIISRGQTHYNRPIEISVGLMAEDTRDYRLLRSEVFSFFNDDEFYISETYESGKRYRVTVLQSYIPERLTPIMARANFMLDMVELPYGESIGTSLDIHRDGINSEDGLWGFGMGLNTIDESLLYIHNTNRFQIYNAGNVPVHPFEHDLIIEISQVQGSTNYFEIWNRTTNERFRINQGVNRTITLDGPNIRSGFVPYLEYTNMKFIELDPGWNDFSIMGADSAIISFDFRFYYL